MAAEASANVSANRLRHKVCKALLDDDAAAIKRLAAQGADLNAWNESGIPMLFACGFATGNEWTTHGLKALLEAGADANFQNGTPMGGAARKGNIEAMQLLLNAGAKVNGLNDYYKTSPLHHATEGGDASAVSFLISLGAKIDEKSPRGMPLHFAAHHARSDAVRELLAAGADMNARIVSEKDYNGQTPLHRGARAQFSERTVGYYEVVRLLVQAGADVNAKDAKGRTALDIARARGNDRLIPLLENPPSAE